MTTSTSLRFDQLVDSADLARAMTDGLVKARPSGDGQTIYNYSDAAMYTPGAWMNPAVRQCRGLIVQDEIVIARPWAKFFNHGQAEAGELDLSAAVEVTDKMDGSLGIIHCAPDGHLRVATRGSFTSDQAIHATAVLHERFADHIDWTDALTPLVEIVYPENRIVCDYGALDTLVLLGAVEIETGTYVGPDDAAQRIAWPGPVTKTFPFRTLADALAAPPRAGAEGLCVRYLDEPRIVKIKQDDYVALHRIVTGLSERTVWERLSAGHHMTDLLGEIPDELHGWVIDVWNGLTNRADEIREEAHKTHAEILKALPSDHGRREYAEKAKKRGSLAPYLFQILDGRDPTPAILKTLRPKGDTRAKPHAEDVA